MTVDGNVSSDLGGSKEVTVKSTAQFRSLIQNESNERPDFDIYPSRFGLRTAIERAINKTEHSETIDKPASYRASWSSLITG